MKIYVNVNAGHDGNGTEQMPFMRVERMPELLTGV